MQQWLYNLFFTLKLGVTLSQVLTVVSILVGIAVVSWIVNFILKHYIVWLVRVLIHRSQSKWGKALIDSLVFRRLSHIGPGLVIYFAVPLVIIDQVSWTKDLSDGVQLLSQVYMLLAVVWCLTSFVNAINSYYMTLRFAKEHPIRGYLQILKIIIWIITAILAISLLLNKSPWAFFTGLGAASAILMLVFKDTILGFVANIQVSAYDMVRVGDWITVPSIGVDGDVMDITVNTVKVRNFDKTIATFPTSNLIDKGVQNWRGMSDSGGRRIKRSINIDLDTIKFCDDKLIKRLEQLDLLKDALPEKTKEIHAHNQKVKANTKISANGRNLTNVGLFRTYIGAYLKSRQDIQTEGFTFLIRQLQPTATGLPIELYVFTTTTNWVEYEGIQSDVFDHLLAALPVFELRAFQDVSGNLVARAS